MRTAKQTERRADFPDYPIVIIAIVGIIDTDPISGLTGSLQSLGYSGPTDAYK